MTIERLLGSGEAWSDFDRHLSTGLSQDPARRFDGGFWAYFHRPDELRVELDLAGFRDVRLTEAEPSMLGTSAHIVGVRVVGDVGLATDGAGAVPRNRRDRARLSRWQVVPWGRVPQTRRSSRSEAGRSAVRNVRSAGPGRAERTAMRPRWPHRDHRPARQERATTERPHTNP